MLSVIGALLLTVPAASTGDITLSVGEPTVFSQTEHLTIWTYPVTATWTITCAAAPAHLYYREIKFGALNENGSIGSEYWSGAVPMAASTESGAPVKDVEPGRVLQGKLNSTGDCYIDLASNTVKVPPRVAGVYPIMTISPAALYPCLVTGTPVHPTVSVQIKLNPGEAMVLHFDGAGLVDHQETFDKARLDNAGNDLYTITTTSDGPVDIWAVHSTSGESNHVTVQSNAQGCLDAEPDGGSPVADAGTSDRPHKTGGCSVASGASSLTTVAAVLIGLALSSRRRQ
jgi:hypothetical protein